MTGSAVRVDVPRHGAGARMTACAHLATELRAAPTGPARSCVSTLRSDAPLVLRMTRPKAPEPWAHDVEDVVRVAVTAGAAGPIGGDELTLTVEVGSGSSLVLTEISPTMLLPGPHQERSSTRVRLRVAGSGTLVWLPEPMIAVRGCDHLNDVTVDLDAGARFFMREEVLLGRHGEASGQVTQRVRVRLDGRPLYRQDLHLGGPDASSPALLGRHRAVGSAVVVDPAWGDHPPGGTRLGGERDGGLDSDAALLPLARCGTVITALAADNLQLRRQLTAGLSAIGPPWAPP